MEKQAVKKTEEALAEIYRNAQLALQSISDILPAVEDERIKEELSRQHESYEHFSAQASILARDNGIELKDPNPMKKMMMWGSIKMSTLTDNSPSHIAEMMVKGLEMGVTSLRELVKKLTPTDDKIAKLCTDVVTLESTLAHKIGKFVEQ